jgi:hypothetical protein
MAQQALLVASGAIVEGKCDLLIVSLDPDPSPLDAIEPLSAAEAVDLCSCSLIGVASIHVDLSSTGRTGSQGYETR